MPPRLDTSLIPASISFGSGILRTLFDRRRRCSGRDFRGANPKRSDRSDFQRRLALGAGGIEQERQDGVLADVFGDVLLRVIRPHLLLVDVFLEDVAEDVGIDFVVGAKRAFIEMPLILVEVIEDAARRLCRESGSICRAFFDLVHVRNRPPLRYGTVPSSYLQPRHVPSLAFAEAFVEQRSKEIPVE